MRSPEAKRLIRSVVGFLGAIVAPPAIEVLWIRASQSGSQNSIVVCLFVGVASVFLLPLHWLWRVVVCVAYVLFMGLVLFAIGASEVCSLYRTCL